MYFDGHIVGAGIPDAHQAVIVKFTLLVTISAAPMAGFGMFPFIFKMNGDVIAGIGPKGLFQAIVLFTRRLCYLCS